MKTGIHACENWHCALICIFCVGGYQRLLNDVPAPPLDDPITFVAPALPEETLLEVTVLLFVRDLTESIYVLFSKVPGACLILRLGNLYSFNLTLCAMGKIFIHMFF
jgi:hypothetical protein